MTIERGKVDQKNFKVLIKLCSLLASHLDKALGSSHVLQIALLHLSQALLFGKNFATKSTYNTH